VVVECLARAFESLILGTLADQPAELLSLVFQHSYSFLERLEASRKDEALAAGEIEKHFDLAVPAIHRNHFRDRAGPAHIDLDGEQATRGEKTRRLANQLSRHRQSILGRQQRQTRLPVTNVRR